MSLKIKLISSMVIISLLISTHTLAGSNKPKPGPVIVPILPHIIGIDSTERILDSYIVTFKDDVVQSTMEQSNINSKSNLVTTKDVNVTFAQSIATSSNSQLTAIYGYSINGVAINNTDESAVLNLFNDSRVDKIYANINVYQSDYNDSPELQAPWGLDRVDQSSYPLDAKYHFSNTAPDIHVFVLDSGIDESHPEFNGRTIDEHTFSEAPCTTPLCSIQYDLEGATDNNGHGTHVAGIIAGKTYGVAKDVKLHSYKLFDVNGRSSLSLLISALDELKGDIISHNSLPAIVNMSFGTRIDNLFNPNLIEPYLTALVNLRNDLGVHMVASAGNKHVENCSSPASSFLVISVGASDMINNQDTRASFSNYGTCVDIYAPGEGIYSAKADTNTSIEMRGTSQAAPFVTGALALYLQDPTHRNDTPVQAKAALIASATTVNLPNTTNSPQKLLNTVALSPLPNQPDQYDDISIRGYTDDNKGDAESLLANTPQTHNFHDAGDEDWTMIWASSIQTYYISTQAIGNNANTNSYIYKVTDIDVNPDYPGQNRFIINSMQLVASDTNGGTSSINFTSESNYLYIIKTVSANNSFGSDSSYSILSQKVYPDSYDDEAIRGYTDDKNGDAEALLANISQTHNFHDVGDEDWNMIWSSAIQTYKVTTQALGSHAGTKLYIYKVTDIIVNPDYPNQNRFIINASQLVASDTNGGNANITFTSEANFLYVIKTISDNNSFGDGTQHTVKQIKLN